MDLQLTDRTFLVFAAHAGVDRDTALTTVVPQAMDLTVGRMSTPEEVPPPPAARQPAA